MQKNSKHTQETIKKMREAKKGNNYAVKSYKDGTKYNKSFVITCTNEQLKKWRKEAKKTGLSGSKWAISVLEDYLENI